MVDIAKPIVQGPLDAYDERVHAHELREDEHQRSQSRVDRREYLY